MEKGNAYSILLRNGFKLMDDEYPNFEKVNWYRGYICAFIKYVVTKEDKELLKDILTVYTDEQWYKLIVRLYKNGHIDKTGIFD